MIYTVCLLYSDGSEFQYHFYSDSDEDAIELARSNFSGPDCIVSGVLNYMGEVIY